jgi:polyphosphate kinase 2 (PPK2 family)
MDAAGKDSAIKHVMSVAAGHQVSFKSPSPKLDHDFLWRTSKSLPERGRIIFNRSYYESQSSASPDACRSEAAPGRVEDIWKERSRTSTRSSSADAQRIRDRKFFLNVSKEQKKRFLERLEMKTRTGSSRWRTPRNGASGRSMGVRT